MRLPAITVVRLPFAMVTVTFAIIVVVAWAVADAPPNLSCWERKFPDGSFGSRCVLGLVSRRCFLVRRSFLAVAYRRTKGFGANDLTGHRAQ